MTGQAARRSRRAAEPRHMERLESALNAAGIDEDRFVEVAVTAISALRSARVTDPSTQFTEDERAALIAGGLDLSPRRAREPDPMADTAARFSALLADSADVAEVATNLRVTRARVRQRAIERTLFAIRENDEWRFPRAQFVNGTPLRGLSAVVSALAADLHPVAAWRFLTEPSPDLELMSEPVSPMTWLHSGGSPEPVAAIAHELQPPVVKLPRPPAALPPLRASDTRTLVEGLLIWRVYRAAGSHPAAWNEFRYHGPIPTGRFDHHEPPRHDDPDRAILYAALDITGALSEAFQDTRTIDRSRHEPWLVGFELELDLVTLDLTRLWPTRAGASQAIATGRRDAAQTWSRSIYDAYPDIRALLYRSSMAGGSLNLALYERAADNLPFNPRFHAPLTHPGLALPLQRKAAQLGYSLR